MEYLQFPKYPETWYGDWEKRGHDYCFLFNCEHCKAESISEKREPMKIYQVKGVTTAKSCFDWKTNSCSSVNSSKCWGPSKRFFTISSSYNVNEFVFKTTSKHEDENGRSFLDEIRVNLNQGNGADRLVYTGIATGRHVNVFLPLITSTSSTPVRRILVKMRSGEPCPKNMDWFTNLKWIYPNHILLRVFEMPQNKSQGVSEEDLELNWSEISQIYLCMYPGGAAFKALQFVWKENDEVFPCYRLNSVRSIREISSSVPYWFQNRRNGYIPGVQAGFFGPVTSYYERLDEKRSVTSIRPLLN